MHVDNACKFLLDSYSSVTNSPDTASMSKQEPGPDLVLQQLHRILGSPDFVSSRRNSEFLDFIVKETIAFRGDRIKGYVIGVDVFALGDEFDPQIDPIVRIQAGRLRRTLSRYYETHGVRDTILISLPKGTYKPIFEYRSQTETDVNDDLQNELGIAVFPFENQTGGDDQSFLADGITEELTIALTRFTDFRVVASQSTLKFRMTGIEPRQAAEELGVRFLLHGSVRKAAEQIRIIAELSDIKTDTQLWGESYSRDLTTGNLFAIQDEITQRVVAAIADSYGAILRTLAKDMSRKSTDDLSAYEATLRFYQYQHHARSASYEETRQALEHAVDRDPDYALAWAMLSELCSDDQAMLFSDRFNLSEQAMEFANRALTLDRSCQYAHFAKAYAHFHRYEKESFTIEAEQVIKMNPNASFLVGFIGFLTALLLEWDKGLRLLKQSRVLNPYYPGWFHLPQFLKYYCQHDFDQALVEAELFCSPTLAWDAILRAAALGQLQRSEEAELAIYELRQQAPDLCSDTALLYRYLGGFILGKDVQEFVAEGLEKAGLHLK
jgi:TolB-like protein